MGFWLAEASAQAHKEGHYDQHGYSRFGYNSKGEYSAEHDSTKIGGY